LAAPRKQISISQSIAVAWQKISTTLAKQVANQLNQTMGRDRKEFKSFQGWYIGKSLN